MCDGRKEFGTWNSWQIIHCTCVYWARPRWSNTERSGKTSQMVAHISSNELVSVSCHFLVLRRVLCGQQRRCLHSLDSPDSPVALRLLTSGYPSHHFPSVRFDISLSCIKFQPRSLYFKLDKAATLQSNEGIDPAHAEMLPNSSYTARLQWNLSWIEFFCLVDPNDNWSDDI